MTCLLGPSVGLASQVHAASGCIISLLEPLQAAFVAEKPGFAGRIWPQHTRKLGLSLSHSLHTPNCSLHPLSDELVAPAWPKREKLMSN